MNIYLRLLFVLLFIVEFLGIECVDLLMIINEIFKFQFSKSNYIDSKLSNINEEFPFSFFFFLF
jgi:hypothetical protein